MKSDPALKHVHEDVRKATASLERIRSRDPVANRSRHFSREEIAAGQQLIVTLERMAHLWDMRS